MFFALKRMLFVCLLRCGSDYFQNVWNCSEYHKITRSSKFNNIYILNVKLCIMKTNVFVMRLIYTFEHIIRNNTTQNNYIKFIFRISNIDYNRKLLIFFSNFFSITDITKSAQQDPSTLFKKVHSWMLIVLTYFWLRWVLLHIWLSFTIHYFIFHFKCYSIFHFAVCQLLCWAFLLLVEFALKTWLRITFCAKFYRKRGKIPDW